MLLYVSQAGGNVSQIDTQGQLDQKLMKSKKKKDKFLLWVFGTWQS